MTGVDNILWAHKKTAARLIVKIVALMRLTLVQGVGTFNEVLFSRPVLISYLGATKLLPGRTGWFAHLDDSASEVRSLSCLTMPQVTRQNL